MFTLDTESGFDQVVFITASYGLGETVVQGAVNPDEFYVYKPNLAAGRPAILRKTRGRQGDQDGLRRRAGRRQVDGHRPGAPTTTGTASRSPTPRSRSSRATRSLIEKHYGRPMDIEWGTRRRRRQALHPAGAPGDGEVARERRDTCAATGCSRAPTVLAEGRAIGQKIGPGSRCASSSRRRRWTEVQPGDVLVADMTDPDWEPVMKRAAAIVTNRGGRTCHAAIIARELGIPAVVGCGDATQRARGGRSRSPSSCAEGDTGHVYEGMLEVEIVDVALDRMPPCPTKIMMNVGNPELAFEFRRLPNEGVGLARLEFIINSNVGIHPKALLELDRQPAELQGRDRPAHRRLREPGRVLRAPRSPRASRRSPRRSGPKKVIVRLSDFKSNEYSNLVGGERYEPHEENPMLGFRGASRYISPEFHDCFALECAAMKRVRDDMGFTNVELMIPFVRTVAEAERRHRAAEEHGLERGENGLRVIMMCEIPSNALLADRFLEHFDGFSIGSNDMTQLTLGARPRLRRRDRRDVRRARRRGEGDAVDGDRRLPQGRQVRRHLRPGAVRPPGSRAVAGRARGSRACRSTPTRSSRPGCCWRADAGLSRPPSGRGDASGRCRHRGTRSHRADWARRMARPCGRWRAARRRAPIRTCPPRRACALEPRPSRRAAIAFTLAGVATAGVVLALPLRMGRRDWPWSPRRSSPCDARWRARRRRAGARCTSASTAASRVTRGRRPLARRNRPRRFSYVGARVVTVVWRPDGASRWRPRAGLAAAARHAAGDEHFRRLRVALRYGRVPAKNGREAGARAAGAACGAAVTRRGARTSAARRGLTGEPRAAVDQPPSRLRRRRAGAGRAAPASAIGRSAAVSSPGCVSARSGERIGPGTTALTRRLGAVLPFVGQRRRERRQRPPSPRRTRPSTRAAPRRACRA